MAKQITVTYWIAFDGTVFNSEEECQNYEAKYPTEVEVFTNYDSIIKSLKIVDKEGKIVTNFPSTDFSSSLEGQEFWQKLKILGKTFGYIRTPESSYKLYLDILFDIEIPDNWVDDSRGYNWFRYISTSNYWSNCNKTIVELEDLIVELNNKFEDNSIPEETTI